MNTDNELLKNLDKLHTTSEIPYVRKYGFAAKK